MTALNRKMVSGRGTRKKALKSDAEKRMPASVPAEAVQTGNQAQPDAPALQNRLLKRFPIVGIGASAGGLEAFTQLL
jgi:chemotaxis response regulator CheB